MCIIWSLFFNDPYIFWSWLIIMFAKILRFFRIECIQRKKQKSVKFLSRNIALFAVLHRSGNSTINHPEAEYYKSICSNYYSFIYIEILISSRRTFFAFSMRKSRRAPRKFLADIFSEREKNHEKKKHQRGWISFLNPSL